MSLNQILRALRARLKIILTLLMLTVLVALAVTLVMPKTYQSTTSLILNNKGTDPVTGQTVPVQFQPGYLPTQIDIVKSEVVALRVIDDLKLTEDPYIKELFAEDERGQVTIRDWLANQLRGNLTVEPARESSVLIITFKGDRPHYVAKVANAFASAYQQVNVDLRVAPALKASGYIDEQIKFLRERFEAAQNRMSAYQKEHRIFSSDNRTDVETARLNELSSQLVEIQALAMDATSRQRNAQRDAGGSPDVLANPLIQSLKSRLIEAETRFAEISARLSFNHPQYIAAKSQVDNLRATLAQQVGLASTGISSNASILKQREAEIRAALNAQKDRVLALNSARDGLSILANETDNAKRAYEAASQRLTQTSLEGKSTQSDISVLTAAAVPGVPSGPRLMLNLLVALVVGTILGVCAAIAMELADRRLRRPEDLTEMFGLPVIGVIEQARAVSYKPQLLLSGSDSGMKSIGLK